MILVANAGSSSIKLSVVNKSEESRDVVSLDEVPYGVNGVAHRIVHGGERFRDPVVIDDAVRDAIESLSDLAPLHNRNEVRLVDEARRLLPGIPHVAVFDTAFHATMPEEVTTYPVPPRWREEWGIRRYGFHGLSLQWAAERVAVSRLVVCHLGAGCSVSAVLDGHSADTSMGFSPLAGVAMATRSGSIDPSIPLYLMRTGRLGAPDIEHALEYDSGLLGLSGISSRAEELERSTAPAAQLALAVFVHQVAAAVGAMTVSLGGIDALVFTGGIGEGSAAIRAGICRRLAFLGVVIDEERNATAVPDAELAAGPARIVALHAREDVIAAREARNALDRR